MSVLQPGRVFDAFNDAFAAGERMPVDSAHRAGGEPWTACQELRTDGAPGLGVWEMSAGAMFDVEADEVFVVISGRATIDFLDGELPPIEVRPGSIVRLAAGMRTRWTVLGPPIRKVYLLLDPEAPATSGPGCGPASEAVDATRLVGCGDGRG